MTRAQGFILEKDAAASQMRNPVFKRFAMLDRNIWIPSRVPQTLQCTECGRISGFVAFHEPDHYAYSCMTCKATNLLTLSQINAVESSRFHKLPSVLPPIISNRAAHHMKG